MSEQQLPTVPPASPVDRIDTSKPHPARVYDWFLGGKDNYLVDEELGSRIAAIAPDVKRFACQNRWFMHRVVRRLSGEGGVRQFLDIGSGIPTEPNLHQIAQGAAPGVRVVYVDNDPIVLAHSEALLDGTPEGVTRYFEADVREPERILELASHVIDFGQPVALSLIALLHFVGDDDGAYDLVARLVAGLPSGSCLALSQLTDDFDAENVGKGVASYASSGVPLVPRSHAGVSRFFEGLELVDPGVVSLSDWHPELALRHMPAETGPVPLYGGVGRKP
ncbi:SAM-dependent methyltransferase [Streptomyces sp. DT24]|uniref:SAM-dependent methyltransferase n=1 Tax=unclassified Streptomyces TaxID=2593676 RepID=UPI0023B8F0CE|nr:SAM-dependent methyltransferase [Streptomyces sp. AM 4-1-1]WEH36765.1 SAM-dependent methyltransferase [Streptomyces sp. AM 4-1-1]